MNKGESNAVGRLGSKSDDESRNKGVRSMSRETGKDESIPRDSEGEGEEFSIRYAAAIATFGSILVGCCVTAILISRMFDEDEIKLQVLDFLVKLLQSIARQCGAWAIECENAYNQYVNILH